MHLVIEKYRNEQSITQPPEPILVPFKRYSRECVVSAIMEFISYNFTMDSPPKYRDCEGDMILLETREAFEAQGSVSPDVHKMNDLEVVLMDR
uniref:Skp1_POZ domain-containing protein n=1 Tax=Loa loa TaxID=7209 RepID=A0A1I7W2B7_LOALO